MTEVDHAAEQLPRAGRFRPGGRDGRVGTGGSLAELVESEPPPPPGAADPPTVAVGAVDTGMIMIDERIHPGPTGRSTDPADEWDGDIRYFATQFGHETFGILRNPPRSAIHLQRGLVPRAADGKLAGLTVAVAVSPPADDILVADPADRSFGGCG